MTLFEYIKKNELDPYDKDRFDLENSIFVREVFSTGHECSVALFQSSDTLEKCFLVSTNTSSSLYGEDDFYDNFLPYTQEATILMSKWLSSYKFRITKNAIALCKVLTALQENKENELDIEERMQSTILHYWGNRKKERKH